MAADGKQRIPEERESFRIRPKGKVRKERQAHDYTATFARLVRGLMTKSRARRESPGGRAAAKPYQQRCAIRFSYSPNRIRGHFTAHARYLIRDSAAGGAAPYGSLGEESMTDALARWQSASDKRLYKVIVSPEFGERVNLTELASKLIASMERDLHRKFEWAAVSHHNTDHPHIHIAIRSVDRDGNEFRFDRDYIKASIRQHAEQLCTLQMGHRTQEDVRLALAREVTQFRFTSLDRTILKAIQHENGSEDHQLSVSDDVLNARLQFLSRAGLVQENGWREWIVPGNLDWTLKQMAVAADRQRMLAQSGVAISDDKMPHCRTSLDDIVALRGRVLANVEEEQTGQMHLILEGTDGVVHFIRHNRAISDRRAKGDLKPNHFVAFEPTQKGHSIKDLGDAEAYLAAPHFRSTPLPAEAASASHNWRGWLGRYHQRLAPVDQQLQQHRVNERGDFER